MAAISIQGQLRAAIAQFIYEELPRDPAGFFFKSRGIALTIGALADKLAKAIGQEIRSPISIEDVPPAIGQGFRARVNAPFPHPDTYEYWIAGLSTNRIAPTVNLHHPGATPEELEKIKAKGREKMTLAKDRTLRVLRKWIEVIDSGGLGPPPLTADEIAGLPVLPPARDLPILDIFDMPQTDEFDFLFDELKRSRNPEQDANGKDTPTSGDSKEPTLPKTEEGPTEKPVKKTSANRKGIDANAKMIAALQKVPESNNWSIRKFADYIGCSTSTINGTPTWDLIMTRRAAARLEKGIKANDRRDRADEMRKQQKRQNKANKFTARRTNKKNFRIS